MGQRSRRDMRAATFQGVWLRVAGVVAVAMTAFDAVLLQRTRGLFTGGFLAVDHLGGWDVPLFAVTSVIIDAAIAGSLAAVPIWLLARRSATRLSAFAGGMLAAGGPLLVAGAVSYQIFRYLGASFDLSLMFDLAGRSVAEVIAVSSTQLTTMFAVALAIAAVGTLAVRWLGRLGGARLEAARPAALWPSAAMILLAVFTLIAAGQLSERVLAAAVRKPSGQALRSFIASVTDVDRDGYGALGQLSDPDPWDARVFPYAPDHPGNGIDEDGIGGDLPAQVLLSEHDPLSPATFQQKPDVVIVALESFRADLLGARFDGAPITPVINSIAAHGVSVPFAYSHNGYTVQSRFHLFAGSLVAQENAKTLIDDFKANGYRVGYFSGQDESFGSAEYRVGFERADEAHDARSDAGRRYSTFATPGSLAIAHDVVQERVTAFLDRSRGDTRPVFLYVNFEDTHFPYWHEGMEPLVSDVRLDRGEISPSRQKELWAMYVNTAANVDRAVGTLLQSVREARGREPGLVITADHGESLFDEGFLGHGYGLNDVQTRIPFVFANLPVRVPVPFGQVDLRGVLLEALAASRAGPPTLEPRDRPVLQYLGTLRSPRQVAYVRNGERYIYDFRARRFAMPDGRWRTPADLAGDERDTFLRLIQHWESINLAYRSGTALVD